MATKLTLTGDFAPPPVTTYSGSVLYQDDQLRVMFSHDEAERVVTVQFLPFDIELIGGPGLARALSGPLDDKNAEWLLLSAWRVLAGHFVAEPQAFQRFLTELRRVAGAAGQALAFANLRKLIGAEKSLA